MVPEYIILHHSATEDGPTLSWDAIRRYHVEVNKWNDIGYHFGIELVKDQYEILVGRQMTEFGAHCQADRMNLRSIGVCLIGNFMEVVPPPEQWALGIKLVGSLAKILEIPVERILGHGQVEHRTFCPGFAFNMEQFREQVRRMT